MATTPAGLLRQPMGFGRQASSVEKLNTVQSNAALPEMPVRRGGEWSSGSVPETPFFDRDTPVISSN